MADISVEDVPKQWRPIVTFMKFTGWLGGTIGVAVFFVHMEAQRVVDKAWSDRQRQEVTQIATAAAAAGAKDAFNDFMRVMLLPLNERVTAHVAEDNQRVDDLKRQVTEGLTSCQKQVDVLTARVISLERGQRHFDALPIEPKRKRSGAVNEE